MEPKKPRPFGRTRKHCRTRNLTAVCLFSMPSGPVGGTSWSCYTCDPLRRTTAMLAADPPQTANKRRATKRKTCIQDDRVTLTPTRRQAIHLNTPHCGAGEANRRHASPCCRRNTRHHMESKEPGAFGEQCELPLRAAPPTSKRLVSLQSAVCPSGVNFVVMELGYNPMLHV